MLLFELAQVADKTGMVNLSLWNEPGKVLQTGDIIRMTRGYSGMFKAPSYNIQN